MKTIRKSRLDDILQMNIKGMTKKQVQKQIYLEIFLIGIISSIIGMILGILLFFPIRSSLTPMFFSSLEPTQISILVNPFWVGLTTLIGSWKSFCRCGWRTH